MSDIKGLREISNDPFGKLLTALSKKFSAFLAKDQAEAVENPEDIYGDGQDVESALKYHNFAISKKFDLTTQYYSASEPDHFNVQLYLGEMVWPTLGTEISDHSGFGNNAVYSGEPILVDGSPFDPGIVDAGNSVKSLAISFNRATSPVVNTDMLQIPDDVNLRTDALTTGFSMFIRFRVRSTAAQGGINRTLIAKVDDDTPLDAMMLLVTPDGRLRFYTQTLGVATGKQTGSNTILVNTVYDVFITFTTGHVMHIWVNNVDKALTDIGTAAPWQSDMTNHDMYIFKRGAGSEGYIDGDLYLPVIYWRDEVLTSTQIGRHWINKITLANIPFGQVAISNYSATVSTDIPAGPSFTTTSFTTTSFTT